MDPPPAKGVRDALVKTWARAAAVLNSPQSNECYTAALVKVQIFCSELLDLQENHPITSLAEEGGWKQGAKEAPGPEEGSDPAPETPAKGVKVKEESKSEKSEQEPEPALVRKVGPQPSKTHREGGKKRRKDKKSVSPRRRRRKSRKSAKKDKRSRSLKSVTQ